MKVTKEDTLLFNLMFLALFLATAANWARVIFPMLAVPWKFHGWDTGLSAPWSLMIFVCIGVECCLIFAASLAIYAAYKGYDYMTLNGTWRGALVGVGGFLFPFLAMAGSSEWNFSEMPIGLVVIAELAGLAVAIPSAMFIDHGERNESPLQPIHDERPVKQQQTVD